MNLNSAIKKPALLRETIPKQLLVGTCVLVFVSCHLNSNLLMVLKCNLAQFKKSAVVHVHWLGSKKNFTITNVRL